MSNKENIALLIGPLKKKDPIAQKQLVNIQGKKLYGLCIRYMGDQHLAKDVLQDSFIRIFQFIELFDPKKGNLQAWMKTITIRLCLNTLKSNKDYKSLYTENGELNHNVLDAHTQNPKAVEKLNTDDLLKLVESLPNHYREIFNLAVIDGYSHKEISKMIGIKESSCRSRLNRAKEMMRNKVTNIDNVIAKRS